MVSEVDDTRDDETSNRLAAEWYDSDALSSEEAAVVDDNYVGNADVATDWSVVADNVDDSAGISVDNFDAASDCPVLADVPSVVGVLVEATVSLFCMCCMAG